MRKLLCRSVRMCIWHVQNMWNVPFTWLMILNSTLDNYWCIVYERLVKFYKQQTINMKSFCKTFADRAQLVDMYIETHTPLNTWRVEFNLELEKGIILQAKTAERNGNEKIFLARLTIVPYPPQLSMSNIITMVYFFVLNLESSLNNKKLIGYNVKIHRRYHRMK